jgi:DNA-binding XRE family transcriptional regulator
MADRGVQAVRKRPVVESRRIGQLRASGWTLARIGQHFGISRQAIYQALQSAANQGAAICSHCRGKFSVPEEAYSVRNIYCRGCPDSLPSIPVGRRIASFRIMLGIDRSELARRLKISRHTIEYAESPKYRPNKRLDELVMEFLERAMEKSEANRDEPLLVGSHP